MQTCVSCLPPLSSAPQLKVWLSRLVLGSSCDGPSEVALNISHMFKFVELLTHEDWYRLCTGCTVCVSYHAQSPLPSHPWLCTVDKIVM